MISLNNLLLGMFSLLFVAFGPGFLIYKYFLPDKKIFWPLVFGFSLLTIFYVSFLASFIGMYNFYFSIGFVTLILVGLLFFGKFKKINFDLDKNSLWLILLFILLAWPRILFSFFFPFTVGDAWASWNRWAVEWFRLSSFSFVNDFTYPQLLPVNLSFIYKLFNQVYVSEYFSHGLTVLFSLFILLLLAHFRSNLSHLTIYVFSLYFLTNQSSFFSVAIGDGLADILVAFFIILSLYLWQEYINNKDRRYLYLTFIMAATGVLTKQAGLFFWIVLPAIIIFYDVKFLGDKLRESFKRIFYPFIISLILILPWYGIQQFSQVATFDQIQDALNGRSILNRILTSIYILVQNFGIYLSVDNQSDLLISLIVFIFGLILLFGIWQAIKKSSFYNILWWFYILPYGILWVLIYSYDARNAFIVLILAFFISFDGILSYSEKYKDYIKFIYNFRFRLLIVFILFLSVFIQRPLYSHIKNPLDFNIMTSSFTSKVGAVSIGDRDLVEALFNDFKKGDILLTNDQVLVIKLHLEDRSIMVNDSYLDASKSLSGAYLDSFEDIDVVLWQGQFLRPDDLIKSLENVLGKNRLELLYYKGNRFLYKVKSL